MYLSSLNAFFYSGKQVLQPAKKPRMVRQKYTAGTIKIIYRQYTVTISPTHIHLGAKLSCQYMKLPIFWKSLKLNLKFWRYAVQIKLIKMAVKKSVLCEKNKLILLLIYVEYLGLCNAKRITICQETLISSRLKFQTKAPFQAGYLGYPQI